MSPSPSLKRVPGIELGLAGLQLALALSALALDLAALCGACSRATDLGLAIAGVGCAGYLALLLSGIFGASRTFYVGVFMAGGVHTGLALWMVETHAFCIPCAIGAAVAFLLMSVSLRTSKRHHDLLKCAYAPTLLLVLAGTFVVQEVEEDRRTAEARDLKKLHPLPSSSPPVPLEEPGAISKPSAKTPLPIRIFEIADCGYCRDFRALYLPRLRRDFGSEISISFHPAERTSWVRRTPTIVMGGLPVFEGFPTRYEDLYQAVEMRLDARKPSPERTTR